MRQATQRRTPTPPHHTTRPPLTLTSFHPPHALTLLQLPHATSPSSLRVCPTLFSSSLFLSPPFPPFTSFPFSFLTYPLSARPPPLCFFLRPAHGADNSRGQMNDRTARTACHRCLRDCSVEDFPKERERETTCFRVCLTSGGHPPFDQPTRSPFFHPNISIGTHSALYIFFFPAQNNTRIVPRNQSLFSSRLFSFLLPIFEA